MKQRVFWLWLAVPLLGAAPAQAMDLIRVPPMSPPVLDGRSTAAKWQSAAQVAGWADAVLGVANADGSTVSLGHRDGTLYLRFACPISEKYRLNKVVYVSNPLKMTAQGKDGDILQDDYVGVYLTPPGGSDLYFLGVNGAGITRDSRNGDLSWDGQWQSQQTHDDNAWTIEFAIPLAQFGAAAGAGAWRINFAHGARQVELLDSLWAFQPAILHPMAEMRLSSQPVAVALGSLGSLSDGTLALRGRVVNGSQQLLDATVEAALHPLPDPVKVALEVPPAAQTALVADLEAPGPMAGTAAVTVADAQGAPLLVHRLPFVFAREVSLETRWIPTPSILQLVLDLGSQESFRRAREARVRLLSADTQQEVLSQSLPPFPSSLSVTDLDCSKLPLGQYVAEVELKMGTQIIPLKDSFIKEPDPAWLGNKIGLSDRVPAPWTSLQVKPGGALTVSCWGRTYTFGAGGFPSQISVLGKDLLARPARLLVKLGGKTVTLPATTARVVDRKEGRVAFRSVAKANDLDITADTWIEFDGFIWNTLTVSSPKPVTVEGLSIEIPLRREHATLWWHRELAHGLLTPQMGAPPQAATASDPLNFLRLGDEERGVQFFYEDLHGWNPEAGRAQELIPGDSEYLLRYNLVGQPTQVQKPLQFALGYMALPCRPRSETFRRVNANNMWAGGRNWPDMQRMDASDWLFQTYTYGSNWFGRNECNYFNLWEPSVYDPDLLPDFTAKTIGPQWEKNRTTGCLYYQANVNDANTPEYRKYRFEWKTMPGNAPYMPPDPKTRDKVVYGSVCQQSRSYVDFQLWHMDRLLRTLSDSGAIPIHGYQDCGGHVLCMNTLHGCPAEGHVPVLGNREWAKRVYIMYKTINPRNQLYIHTGGESVMSWCSFFDVMIEGEQFTAPYLSAIVSDPTLPKDYTHLINLDRYRAQLQGLGWGPERFMLTQFWDWRSKEPDEARATMGHLWGMSLAHDVPVWGVDGPAAIARAISEVGWDDQAKFVPYWRKQTGVTVTASASPVVASAWQCSRGGLLVLVLNDSDQTATGELKLDLARFGLGQGAVTCRDYGNAGLAHPDVPFTHEMKTQQDYDVSQLPVRDQPVENGAVAFEVGRHSFRLLRFYQ